jgi:hypothetical protein
MDSDTLYIILLYTNNAQIRLLNKFSKRIYDKYYDKSQEYLVSSWYSELTRSDMSFKLFNDQIEQLKINYKHYYLLVSIKKIFNNNFRDYYKKYPVLEEYITQLKYDTYYVEDDHIEIDFTGECGENMILQKNINSFRFFTNYVSNMDMYQFEFVLDDDDYSPIVQLLSLMTIMIAQQVGVKLFELTDEYLFQDTSDDNVIYPFHISQDVYSEFDKFIEFYIDCNKHKILYEFIKEVKPFSKIKIGQSHIGPDHVVLDMDTYILDKIEKLTYKSQLLYDVK